MIECTDCGTTMEEIVWEKHHGKCKDCRIDPVFTDEQKLEIVTAYLTGHETQEQVCKRIGITVGTFSAWRKQIKTIKHEGISFPPRRNFTDAEKLNILNGYNSHDFKSVSAYCRSVGIHQTMYRKWKIAMAYKTTEPVNVAPDNIDKVIAELADIQPGLDREEIDAQIALWRQRITNLMQGALPAQLASKILERCIDEMESFLS